MENHTVKKLLLTILALFFALLLFRSLNFDSVSSQVVSNVDKTAPAVSITSSFDSVNNPYISVSGTSSNDVKEVRVKLNNGNWEIASGTRQWTKSLTLSPGHNTIYVQSFNKFNNISPVSSLEVNYNNY